MEPQTTQGHADRTTQQNMNVPNIEKLRALPAETKQEIVTLVEDAFLNGTHLAIENKDKGDILSGNQIRQRAQQFVREKYSGLTQGLAQTGRST